MAASDAEDGQSPSASADDSGDQQEALDDIAELHPREGMGTQNGSKGTNAKDALRPRRKKARRACYACQRAHLTCGDERPCQRCIKRGLQDTCQDGVRKKAKYLHDAPPEALAPGVGGKLLTRAAQTTASEPHPKDGRYQPTVPFQPVSPFLPLQTGGQMGPRLSQDQGMNSSPFGSQTSGPSDFTAITSNPVLPPVTPSVPTVNSGWNGALFDPSDPALFNFDLASMNFGSHYGALEFGMLGHMATGVGDTPSDAGTQRGSVGQPGSDQFVNQIGSFNESPSGHQPFAYGGDTVMTDWPRNQSYFGLHKPEPPHAFAIESNAYFTSPDNSSDLKYEESPTMTNSMFKSSAHPGPAMGSNIQDGPHSTASHSRQPPQISTPQLKAKSQIAPKPTRRTRDPSAIYSIVTTPHPYTRGFHALIAYLQRRFSSTPAKTLAIAKSLASIRPSFIATTKTLKQDDLIFMEKCFQRTLWEYEGFIEGVGTPTIVARRTGEIAAVGKEFEILTGWNRRVLLGKAPNLNVNRGRSPGSSTTGGTGPTSGDNTTGRGTGINTPTQRHGAIGYDTDFEKHPQPVFLAELLDDDSVVTFYEDFARLAFGDSRGSVMGRVKLLKYQTQEDQIAQNLKREAENLRQNTGKQSIFQSPTEEFKSATNLRPPSISARKAGELKKEGISGEKGMQRLGSADGKVECSFCWTVKRDVFDIPMLIVMNFLPCI